MLPCAVLHVFPVRTRSMCDSRWSAGEKKIHLKQPESVGGYDMDGRKKSTADGNRVIFSQGAGALRCVCMSHTADDADDDVENEPSFHPCISTRPPPPLSTTGQTYELGKAFENATV